MWTRKTLRKMPPLTRALAKICNAIELEQKRLGSIICAVGIEEMHAHAAEQSLQLANSMNHPITVQCQHCSGVFVIKRVTDIPQEKCPYCEVPVVSLVLTPLVI